MDELLTTGQLIDRLKVGETAIGYVKSSDVELKIFKDESGHIRFYDTQDLLKLSAGFVDSVKWCILPNYVSLQEALEANTNGKWVYLHRDDGVRYPVAPNHMKIMKLKNHGIGDYSLVDLVIGKWTIEEDEDE